MYHKEYIGLYQETAETSADYPMSIQSETGGAEEEEEEEEEPAAGSVEVIRLALPTEMSTRV